MEKIIKFVKKRFTNFKNLHHSKKFIKIKKIMNYKNFTFERKFTQFEKKIMNLKIGKC